MAAGDLTLAIAIKATDGASSIIRGIGTSFGPLGAGMATLVIGAAAVGIEATKMAGDFQQSMLSLVAHAGLAKSQFDNVSQSVLAMSTVVGRSPTQLAEALYPILSAFSGIQNQAAKSSIALATLKMSFETVAGTTVDGTAVANAAVGTFNALGLATNNAATNTQRMTGLFDIMDKTVQLGNMQWDAYKNVVSKLAVAIQGTGITFKESQAALATMTNEGFSAQRASTYLSNTFTTLAIKTDLLAKHAKSLGISFDESKYGPMTLAQKIEYLNQITDGNKQKLLALMGNNSTALKTFNALSVGIGSYKSNLDALNHAQGTLAGSFATASQGFNFQMSQLKAAGDALIITIGERILPVATKVVAAITPLVSAFTAWIASGRAGAQIGGLWATVMHGVQTVLTALSPGFAYLGNLFRQIGGILASAFIPVWKQLVAQWQGEMLPALKQMWAALQPAMPLFKAIGLIIVTVVIVALGLLVGILTGVAKAVAGLLGGVMTVFTGIVQIISGAVTVIGGILGFFTDLLTGNFTNLGNDLHNIWQGIVTMFTGAWHVIEGIFQAAWGIISGFVSGLVQGVIAYFQNLWNTLVGHSIIPDMINAIVNWFKNFVTWVIGIVVTFVLTMIVRFAILKAEVEFLVSQLVKNVVTFFTNLPGQAMAAITTLATNLKNFFGNLASQAVQWGSNLINGVINGIKSMFGAVGNTMGGLVNLIGSFLPHSPAKQGELAHLNEYGPNLVKGIAHGILGSQSILHGAMAQLTRPIGSSFALSGGAGGGNSFALSGGQTIIVQVQPTKQDIYLDKRKVGEGVMEYASRQVRLQGVKNR